MLCGILESHSSKFGKLDDPDLEMELDVHIDQIIDNLLIKTGDDNQKLKTNAHTGLRKISNFELINYRK